MIYLSAGHYPVEPGACYQGFCEHEEAVRWAGLIQALMGDSTSLVIPSGTIKEKLAYVNKRKPTAVVEIHFNSHTTQDMALEGYLTMHQPNTPLSSQLSHLILDILDTTPNKIRRNRGAWVGYHRLDESFGLNKFLAGAKVPTIIIEPEFIHQRYLIEVSRGQVCQAIATALTKFLCQEDATE